MLELIKNIVTRIEEIMHCNSDFSENLNQGNIWNINFENGFNLKIFLKGDKIRSFRITKNRKHMHPSESIVNLEHDKILPFICSHIYKWELDQQKPLEQLSALQLGECIYLEFKDLTQGILKPKCKCNGVVTVDYDGEETENYYMTCTCGDSGVISGYVLDSMIED